MWNNGWPCATFWPSVKSTAINCPAICDFTCTTALASTVPMTLISVGTDCSEALAMDTGNDGIMLGPPLAPAAGASACLLHPDRTIMETMNTQKQLRIKIFPQWSQCTS